MENAVVQIKNRQVHKPESVVGKNGITGAYAYRSCQHKRSAGVVPKAQDIFLPDRNKEHADNKQVRNRKT